MRFIKRIPITASMISGEQAQQTDLWYTNEAGALVAVAPWVSGQNVALGDRRSHNQKVWQALSTHASTAEPDIAPTLWQFVAPTNRWAAFDDAVGSAIQETGSLSFRLAPGVKFDSFGCLGMVGNSLSVDVAVPGSSNLSEFSAISLPVVSNWSAIAYGSGNYVAVSYNGHVCSSSDGSSWLPRSLSPTGNFRGVAFGNGLFVAVSATLFVRSADGVNWSSYTPPLRAWVSVVYGNGVYLAVSQDGYCLRSLDGISWVEYQLPSVAGLYRRICFGSGRFVVTTGGGGGFATSIDGISWSLVMVGITEDYRGIVFGDGVFLAVAYQARYGLRSNNGVNWQSIDLKSAENWQSVSYGNGVFLAIAESVYFSKSFDGIDWEVPTYQPSLGGSFIDIVYGANKFVLINSGATNVAATADFLSSIYKTTIPLIKDEEPVIDFWTYCFAGFKQKEDLIVTGLNSASYTNATITITINGATVSDPVKLGTFNFGMVQVLGVTEMGMKTGITNYSTYDVDQFGVTRIVPRSFAKKINANVMVDRENYNTVYQALVDYKDTAVIVFPSDSEDYSKANAYGHIREWSLSIDYPTYTMLPIEVRGLT